MIDLQIVLIVIREIIEVGSRIMLSPHPEKEVIEPLRRYKPIGHHHRLTPQKGCWFSHMLLFFTIWVDGAFSSLCI
ncbi:unnamed protein product [Lactuca virosa]|uniref:Uncharacterized protein n=1 Tax=Lactuca virosa TaxID=75947 RepID=A0AAU9P1V3_9ASTR|nr:unnamed protein product [Lactuca virosa]